jgi:hypothetical protein
MKKSYGKKILICGHSDHPMTNVKSRLANLRGYRDIFGTNLQPLADKAHAIPLGLTNDTNESLFHHIFADTKGFLPILETVSRPSSFTNDIYANFSIHTNRGEREKLAQILENLNTFIVEPIMSETGRLGYLRSLREANFVICPEGNGVDTHRLWETLYMGGTPIVKSNPLINSLVLDLPVMVVGDWQELLNTRQLELTWLDIHSKNHSSNKLRFTYWESVFSNAHGE